VGNDEDGVTIVTNGGQLRLGPNTLQFVLHGVGGILNGWMDLNGDGDFADLGEHVIENVDLNPGTRQVVVSLPQGTVSGPIAARFRWGETGLGFEGPAGIGEVEDYYLPSTIPFNLAGDFNGDLSVDQLDYNIWRETFDSTTDLRADANGNGRIDLADLAIWRKNNGTSAAAAAAASVPFAPTYGSLPAYFGNIRSLREAGLVRTGSVPGPGLPGSSEPLFVGLDAGTSASRTGFSPTSRVGFGAGIVHSGAPGNSLLVLDQAWAEMDDDEAADELTMNWADSEFAVDDQTLSTVFEDESQLWKVQ
jgi:hypothetical protein